MTAISVAPLSALPLLKDLPALLPELFAALALCCVGALGGVCAAACARRPE